MAVVRGEKGGRLAANGLAEVAGVAAVVPKISKVPGVSEVAAEVPEVSEAHSGGPQHFNIHSQDDVDEAIQVSDKVTIVGEKAPCRGPIGHH